MLVYFCRQLIQSIPVLLILFTLFFFGISNSFAQETITDIDGNVYETVVIGDQRWIKSNLRVKHYRNGDPIPEIKDPGAWANTRQGAWCYFNNDPTTEERGLLYNAYAFLDPRGLAPEGTYVTSLCDWGELFIELEGRLNVNNPEYYNSLADKIKDPSFVLNGGNSNPTNSSGLSFIRSGRRIFSGVEFFFDNTPLAVHWTTDYRGENNGVKWYYHSFLQAALKNWYWSADIANTAMSIRVIVGEPKERAVFRKEEQSFCGPSFVSELQFSVQREDSFLCGFTNDIDCYRQTSWYRDIEFTIPIPSNAQIKDGDVLYGKAEYIFPVEVEVGTLVCYEEILEVTVRILEPQPPTGEQSQVFCAGATVEDLVAEGDEIRWYPTLNSTTPIAPGTLLQNSRFYYAENRDGTCVNPTRLRIQVELVSPTQPIAEATQEICAGTRLSGLAVQGTDLIWYSEAGEELSAETLVADNVTYFVASKVADCESNRTAVKTVLSGPPLPTATENQELCPGSKVSELVATGQNILWYAVASGGSPMDAETLLEDGKSYFATQTVDGCESGSRKEVKVSLLAVPPVTAPQLQEFCNASTVANLQATGINIRWYSDQSLTAVLTPNSPLENGRTYYVTQTINGCEGPALAVQVAVNAVSIPQGESEQNFCLGAQVSDLVASGAGIQWFAAATGGTALSSTQPLQNGLTYYAEQRIGNCQSAARLAVRVTVASVDLPAAAATQTFCAGALVSDIAVTGQNIRWYASATENDPVASNESLQDGRIYYASQTVGSCESASRRAVRVRVVTVPQVSAPQTQSFCNTATVSNLQATGTAIRWYADQSLTTLLASTSPLENGRTYYATQTIEGCEGPSLAVQVAINAVPAPQGDSEQGFCTGALVSDLVATGTNVRWYNTATGGTPIANNLPLQNGSTYYAEQTIGSCNSAVRLAVTVSVSSADLPTASANQTFCTGASISDIAITGQNVRWYASATGNDLLSNTALLVDGRTYFATQTVGGCESASRRAVLVRVINVPQVTTAQSQAFCNAATVSNLQATGTNVRWYADQNLTTALSPNSPLENGRTYFATQTQEGCESAPVAVQVTINQVAAPSGLSDQEFCNGAFVDQLQATGTAVQWFSTGTGGNPLAGNLPLQDGNIYYAEQTLGSCKSATRLAVRVRINIPQIPGGASQQEFCEGARVSELQATGTNLVWYRNASGPETLNPNDPIQDGGVYFVSQRIGNCESARKEIRASIIRIQPAVAEREQQFCESDQPTVARLFAVGETIRWYSSPSGGQPLSESERLQDGQTYYAANVSGNRGCESSVRVEVRAIVQPCEVEVFNMVTRDGNNKNEYLKIKNIESFPENRLEIYNRHGVLVWAADGYGKDGKFFFGESNQPGVSQPELGLPTGNYLYALTYKNPAATLPVRVTGYLYLLNTQRK
jgi:uncharacterized protein (TIGR02145 family)